MRGAVNKFASKKAAICAENEKFRVFFTRFQPKSTASARQITGSPVFLLVLKLTMNENGTDNLVICHTQTIEPVIRTFQSG